MLSLSNALRYFLYREDTDMRKGFDGLSGVVRQSRPHSLLATYELKALHQLLFHLCHG
jgi:hypothetical protein